MSLFGKLVVSLLIAAIASVATVFAIPDVSSSWSVIFIIFAVATIASSLLSSMKAPGTANGSAAASKAPAKKAPAKKTKTKEKPAKAPAKAKSGGKREEGQVKWFNVSKGFGFITRDNGEEIFVHFRSILGEGRRGLKDGQRVSFVVADSDKGLQAEEVEGL
jgi:cold shock protein